MFHVYLTATLTNLDLIAQNRHEDAIAENHDIRCAYCERDHSMMNSEGLRSPIVPLRFEELGAGMLLERRRHVP
jgi:hypothetical protein